jgi:hypothetical protein
MKAHLILAEAATANPGGSVSMLNGGIAGLSKPAGQDLVFPLSMIVQFIPGFGEQGQHPVRVKVIDEDGRKIAEVNGTYDVKKPARALKAMPFAVKFPGPGRYTFSLLVDNQELDAYSIDVVER